MTRSVGNSYSIRHQQPWLPLCPLQGAVRTLKTEWQHLYSLGCTNVVWFESVEGTARTIMIAVIMIAGILAYISDSTTLLSLDGIRNVRSIPKRELVTSCTQEAGSRKQQQHTKHFQIVVEVHELIR